MAASKRALEREIQEKLDQTEPDMYGNLKCDEVFLACLVKEGVLRPLDKEEMECNTSKMKRIGDLYTHIRRDPRNRYHGFIRALIASDQKHIVTDILKEPLPESKDTSKEVQRTPLNKKDKEIKELADNILKAIKNNLVYLKGSQGLDFNEDVNSYLIQWNILTERDRMDIKELPTKSSKITHILDQLPRRPAPEIVLFAKVIIETSQGHQLDDIGIPVSKVKDVDMNYCLEKCGS